MNTMQKKTIFITMFMCCALLLLHSQEIKFNQLLKKSNQFLEKGEIDSANYYAIILETESRNQNQKNYLYQANELLAEIAVQKGDVKKAFDLYFNIIKSYNHDSLLLRKAKAFNNIGFLYFDQKQYEESKSYLKQEILIRKQLGDSIKLANNYINLGTVYRRLFQFDSVYFFLNIAGEIAIKKNNLKLKANYFNILGNYYFTLHEHHSNRKQLDSAVKYYNYAISIWSQKNDIRNLIKPLTNLGYAYQLKGKWKDAVILYKKVEYLSDSMGLFPEKLVLYKNISETYYDLAEYKSASDYMRKLILLKDSVQKNELNAYSIQLDKQYQLETKTKTILEQTLELEQKNNELLNKQKQIYLFLLLLILTILIVVLIVIYFNFNKKLMKKIEEAKEKFFVNIMHEIKTPLSMIQAPLKALKPKLKQEEELYYLNLAEKNTIRLNELMLQMLEISKIDSGNYKLQESTGYPLMYIQNVLEAYEKLALENNIHFIKDIQPDNVQAIFDKDALDKMLNNLLSNAFKYTRKGGHVGINVNSEVDENHLKLKIEVWDTGIGIPKQEQDKVFTRFFRSENTKHQAKGIGVGLSLVKDIVDAHRGEIWFKSEETKGSSFSFVINLRLAQNHETLYSLQKNEENKQPLILIVEDDKDIRGFLTNYLKSKKYSTIDAFNGKTALTILKNTCPDLIITDLMMEEMDGLTFIKELKKEKGLSHIPVIVLSAKSSSDIRIETLNAGAQVFLSKPFIPEELFSSIENQLQLIHQLKKEHQVNLEVKNELSPELKFSSKEPYLQKLYSLIFSNLDNSELSVEYLADLMATNRSHFQRKVKSLSSYSPSELIKMIRLEKAKEFLDSKKGNVTQVAYMCGFSSQSYFTRCFTEYYGKAPSQS